MLGSLYKYTVVGKPRQRGIVDTLERRDIFSLGDSAVDVEQ